MKKILYEINKIRVKEDLLYRSDCPTIHKLLADWLNEEIHFQQKEETPLFLMPSNEAGELTKYKYSLNLSVGQLGLMSRLLMEFCFFERPVYKRVAKDVAKIFCTKKAGKSEDLSAESVFGKFYKHDHATKEIIVEILLRMVKRVREL
jgi:hypothetical protein